MVNAIYDEPVIAEPFSFKTPWRICKFGGNKKKTFFKTSSVVDAVKNVVVTATCIYGNL